jgi:large subunit ribosomal protein L15
MGIGIHNMQPTDGSTHRRKRVGRGIGSGHGKTATRGHKGNKARGQVNPNFEGGQTPLHRRLPQLRGTSSRNPRGFKPYHKTEYALVNVNELEAQFDAGAEITPELLMERGILRNLHDGVKILGDGEVTKKFTVRAHKFSASAQEKLQSAGGTVETLAAERR